jgi:hypothetical protein
MIQAYLPLLNFRSHPIHSFLHKQQTLESSK